MGVIVNEFGGSGIKGVASGLENAYLDSESILPASRRRYHRLATAITWNVV